MIIRGRVINGQDGSPLASASLTIVDSKGNYLGKGAIADANGRFEFANELLNYNDLLITYAGYQGTIVKPGVLNSAFFLDVPLFPAGELETAVVTAKKTNYSKVWATMGIFIALGLLFGQGYKKAK